MKLECAATHLSGCIGAASICCGQCGVVRYCSRFHQRKHWKDHKRVCARMAQQAQKASSLSEFPFLFELETSICDFLENRGLHGQGLWSGECTCFSGDTLGRDWHLPSNACPCKEPRDRLETTLQSWKQYYDWRNLPLDSPVAILLHWPLTIYHAIKQSRFRFQPRDKMVIHYLGPERELQYLEIFLELLALFPGVQIHIDFVGPAVPTSSHKNTQQLDSYPKCLDSSCECKVQRSSGFLTVCTWNGLYHDVYTQIPRPDVIVAPNAGIAAFISWRPTIELLLKLKVPVFVTDFCEEACVLAVECIDSLEPDRVTFPITENPFKQPTVPSNKSIDLPMHSNCFMFGLD